MANVVIELSSDEQKLFRAYQKLIAEQNKMEAGLGKVKKTGKDAGKSTQEAFGESARSSLASYIGGIATLSGGIGIATQAWREHMQVRTEAMASYRALEMPQRQLVQVAQGGTAEEMAADLKDMEQRASEIAIQAGISLDEATRLMFTARSQGREEALRFITENARVISPSSQMILAADVPGLFAGEGQRITPEGAIAGTLAAASQSKLNVEQIAAAMPKAAKGTALLGTTPEETMALLARLAVRNEGQGEVAATQLSSFAAALSADPESRFAGQGVLGALDKLQAMTEEDRRKVLGTSKEMNIAFTQLSEEEGAIRASLPSIRAAAQAPEATMEPRRQAYNIVHGERLAADSAERQLEVSKQERFGRRETMLQANADFIRAQLEEVKVNALGRFAANMSIWWDRNWNPDISTGEMHRRASGAAGTFDFGAARRMQDALEASAENLREATNELRRAAPRAAQPNVAPPRPQRHAPAAQRELNNVPAE